MVVNVPLGLVLVVLVVLWSGGTEDNKGTCSLQTPCRLRGPGRVVNFVCLLFADIGGHSLYFVFDPEESRSVPFSPLTFVLALSSRRVHAHPYLHRAAEMRCVIRSLQKAKSERLWLSPLRTRRPYDPVPTKTAPTGEECMEQGCHRRARFALKDNREPAYCARHK